MLSEGIFEKQRYYRYNILEFEQYLREKYLIENIFSPLSY